jgi:hypothetical protein
MKKSIFGCLHKTKEILYIANHKAACTTLAKTLAKYGYTNRGTFEVNISKLNYVFTFVRNPYERLVSRYVHMKSFFIEEKDRPQSLIVDLVLESSLKKYFDYHNIEFTEDNFTFPRFVKFAQKNSDRHWESQIDKFERQVISLDNIDFIGRFENLQEDFNIICDKIGIPRQQLPHKNKSKHKHYTEYYNDETRQIVAEKYAKDIEYFGYKFGK